MNVDERECAEAREPSIGHDFALDDSVGAPGAETGGGGTV